MHPVHPMLVHLPIACWVLTPVCDALALTQGADVFWSIGAFLAAAGVGFGALAATAGSLDFARGHATAPKVAIAHATLMGAAWILAIIGLLGRLGPQYSVLAPPPAWAVATGAATLLVMAAGAWCGGELVYGRGVGVREE